MWTVKGCYHQIVSVVLVTIAKTEVFHFDIFYLNFLIRL